MKRVRWSGVQLYIDRYHFQRAWHTTKKNRDALRTHFDLKLLSQKGKRTGELTHTLNQDSELPLGKKMNSFQAENLSNVSDPFVSEYS